MPSSVSSAARLQEQQKHKTRAVQARDYTFVGYATARRASSANCGCRSFCCHLICNLWLHAASIPGMLQIGNRLLCTASLLTQCHARHNISSSTACHRHCHPVTMIFVQETCPQHMGQMFAWTQAAGIIRAVPAHLPMPCSCCGAGCCCTCAFAAW